MNRYTIQRALLVVAGTLALVPATLIAAWVIPAVQTDPMATVGPATTAFWTTVAANGIIGLGLIAMAYYGHGELRTAGLSLAVAATLFMALLLLDAEQASSTHGPSMDTATALIATSAIADAAVAVLIIVRGIVGRIGRAREGSEQGHRAA